MKLKAQIINLGLAGVLLATLVGGIGIVASLVMGDTVDSTILAGEALQLSQEADMMHDALRGDAQLALLSAGDKNSEQLGEAAKGLKEHSEVLDSALSKLRSLPMTAQSLAALDAAQALVKPYEAAVEAVVKGASVDLETGLRALPALQASFTALEEKMATLSDTIEANGQTLNAQAKARVDQTLYAIVMALALATSAMAAAALWLSRRMTRPMAHAVSVADRLAQGDLSVRIEPAGNDETEQLLVSMERMQTSFAAIVREVKSNAERVACASTEIATGNLDLSIRTEQQASVLQQTAASMEELSTTVRQNADHSRKANALAQDASGVAVRGGEVVQQVVCTMKGIDEASKKIADIIGVIDSIAFQTNILALNAAVEAARAGEQGRGFAVVAGEVRGLAQRSASAAKEIKTLIHASAEQVNHGTTLADQAGETMTQVVESIRHVSSIVAGINAASAEQSSGVERVGAAVVQMDQTTQQNAALVEESAAAAEALKQQSQSLVQAVAVFRLAENEGS